jgi:hypothetical protein
MRKAFAVAVLMATASFGATTAGAGSPNPLPQAVVSAGVTACTTTPCQNDFSVSAGVSFVPVSQFGDNYTVTTVDEGGNPIFSTTTQNTPGELVVGDVSSDQYAVATANGSPKVTASGSIFTGVGGTINSSILTYFFEIVPDQGQGALTPVTVGVNATGTVSGSSTSPVNTFDSLNSEKAIAEFTIANTFDEVAEAEYAYVCLLADNDCSQTSNSSTSNVDVALGTTSTFSGGFHLVDMPLTLITDHPYQVTLSAELVLGAAPGTGMASVDPMIDVPEGYTLELSPGISAGGVPEPATWATMLVGFGAMGAALRRRRAKAQAH